jgi:uncharacterized cupredoxin-like copper-binding protein
MSKRWARALILVPLILGAGFLVACGGDDDENAGPTAEPGVVSAKPEDATQVDVTLQEWAIAPVPNSVKAGKVYFLVENKGPDHAHEFVIIRTDLGPLDLPFEDNLVPEEQVDFVDEISEFASGSSASLTVDLTPGKYLLICNILEGDEAIGNHYKKGMVAALTVE